MRTFTIIISQNGWEYTGYMEIEADEVRVKENDDYIAVVVRGNDTFELRFDEQIRLE